ncbi:hypothetical protein O6P43_021958 [Quillaja saponaria]|uniref:Uncharacterized protein n=1 Tax=Quillaja saponaria TaxID=32244 RepID=A0AAD7LDE5_QUISA|nr:hypothetical protein O6P43_021958 [Quillaja saponaria]
MQHHKVQSKQKCEVVFDSERAMARVRSIHAVTSLTAVADIAMRPTSVVRSFSSARTRARIGNAVMESTTPLKTRKGSCCTFGYQEQMKTQWLILQYQFNWKSIAGDTTGA